MNYIFSTSDVELNNNNINDASTWVSSRLKEAKFSNSDVIKNSFMVEEILLQYQKQFHNKGFNVNTKSILNNYRLVIEIEGESYDFRRALDESNSDFVENMIVTIDKSLSWEYVNGKNCIEIILRKRPKLPEAVGIMLGAVMAIIVSMLLPKLPSSISTTINDLIIPSLQEKFNGILRMIAGLMVFFSISSGIYAMENVTTLKKTLNDVLTRIFFNNAIITVVIMLIFVPFFGIGNSSPSMAFEGVWNLILDILPIDIISPFIDGNIIQITVFALTIGTMLLIAGNSQRLIYATLAGGTQVVNMAMQNFCKIMPLFVFINLLAAFSQQGMENIEMLIFPVLLGIVAVVVIFLLQAIKIWILYKISPVTYMSKILPGVIVGFSTASTSAALNTIKNDLISLGIEEKYINLLLPLEQAFYKPFSILIVITGAFAYASIEGRSYSIASLIALFILTQIIAFACPSIPGGMLSCLTILVSQMGFPQSAMGVLVTISTIMDYFGAIISVSSIHAEITEQACIAKKI